MKDFEVVLMKLQSDYEALGAWWEHWDGYHYLPPNYYPELTAVTFYCNRPVCAASFYESNTPIVFIDNVVSDPESDPKVRDAALDLCFAYLFDLARKKGFKHWSGHTKIESLKKRAHQFRVQRTEDDHIWMTGEI